MDTADWNPDPNDPLLQKLNMAPFEGSAVLRMRQHGWRSQKIMDTLRVRGSQLVKNLEVSNDAQSRAQQDGRDVHNALISEENS